jgi:hypothetical protein
MIQIWFCLSAHRNNTEVRVESTPGRGLVRPGPSEVKEVIDNPEVSKAKSIHDVA